MSQPLTKDKNPTLTVADELTKLEELKRILDDEGMLYDEHGQIDEALLLGTIEGETDLQEMLLELDESIAEYESKADAVKIRIEGLTKRKNRLVKSADTLRTVILAAMDRAGIQKIDAPHVTISLKKKPQKLIVTDEALVPSKYFKAEPKLQKKDLTADLKEGQEIEGAELDNGGISLMIRRS